jgi:hypothetical protein
MSGSFCHHGPGGCNDSCYICLAPLGPGQADDAQIANALLTGAVVCLAPGDWLINGAVVTYTQAQELHGPAPADDGVMRLSYSDAITLESSDATGRYALNTYDATFNGVIDHTSRYGFNNGATGGPSDPAMHEWGMQFEANYKPAAGATPIYSEWFLQWRPSGLAYERRPIGVMVDEATGLAKLDLIGQVCVYTTAVVPRLAIPDGVGEVACRGDWSFLNIGGGNETKLSTWGLMLMGANAQIYGTGPNVQVYWESADLGHGVAPTPFKITPRDNSHADTPLVGWSAHQSPVAKKGYTVAQLNGPALSAAKAVAGNESFCTDETGGAVPVFSDGTDWRRVTDRAIIS